MPTEPPSASLTAVFKKPFPEQIAFFRAKLGDQVLTQRWDDLWKAQHDSAFMVAGAAKADLLADLAKSLDSGLFGDTGIEGFRKGFDEAVEKYGWAYNGSRNWRTRVIYNTNAATSYAAGRLAQLRADGFKYFIYRHMDGEMHPRPLHESWNGLTLPANHPWWHTHYPPNGWGCQCYVIGAHTPELAQVLGGRVVESPPDDGINPKTGEPNGIDKGWGYMPGDTVSDKLTALRGKLDELPAPLSVAVIQDWISSPGFADWWASPSGNWPLVRLPAEDARAIGAQPGKTVADLSTATARKQRADHPEMTVSEYLFAQDAVDNATGKVQDTPHSIIYVRDVGSGDVGGYVLVVKATRTGKGLFVTSYRRLSRDDALRDAEIQRLLAKGKK